MKLSIIIVNFHSESYTLACVDSLRTALIPVPYEIILVHNEKDPVPKTFEILGVKILHTSENMGYAKACNLGASLANGDIFWFLNPDTQLLQNQNILSLLALFKNKVSIVGHCLLDNPSSLSPQKWSIGNDPSLIETIKNHIGLNKDLARLVNKVATTVDWVSGASMFIKNSSFKKLGGFDDKFFMYFEDVDLCKRARMNNMTVVYFPNYKIVHWSGKSHSLEHKKKQLYYSSQKIYIQKYFSNFHYTLLFFLKKVSDLVHRLQ